MKRAIALAALLTLALAPAASAKQATFAYTPADPVFGGELTVTGGVFAITCTQGGVTVYSDGGNASDPTVTLAGSSWTGGAAECEIDGLAQKGNGDPKVVVTLQVDVEG